MKEENNSIKYRDLVLKVVFPFHSFFVNKVDNNLLYRSFVSTLKWQCHEIFDLYFFLKSNPSGSGFLSHISCLLSHVSCLKSPVSRLLSHISCPTSPVPRLLSHVSYLTSTVSRLLSHVFCPTTNVSVNWWRSWRNDPGRCLFLQSVLKIPKLSARYVRKSAYNAKRFLN